jgi:hypothetical protein
LNPVSQGAFLFEPVEPEILSITAPAIEVSRPRARSLAIADSPLLWLIILTPLALMVHGYHPYADDAGIYVAGVKKMMRPSLFTTDAMFVVAHTQLSVFSHVLAAIVRVCRIPLEPTLFLGYLLSIYAFLLACWQLATRIFTSRPVQWAAVLLAAATLTLPVTGTALAVMDPYLTARSFSTPFALFALVGCLDRSWKRTLFWLAAAAAMHPLMAIYSAAFLAVFVLIQVGRPRAALALCGLGFALCGGIYLATLHQPVDSAYLPAVMSRQYFFLVHWHWYELLGLVAPLALMMVAARRSENDSPIRHLSLAAIAVGCTALLCSLAYVHPGGPYLLARVQILRSFHSIYAIGIVLLGGLLGRVLLKHRAWIGAVTFSAIAGIMLFAQLQTYSASAHVEWPWAAPHNQWQQAFLWIRNNTPQNALFALDSSYTTARAEDTQGFRAIAERSSLVDGLKDGGVVAVFPALAPLWNRQRLAVLNLSHASDAQRVSRLRPLGVSWLVLDADTPTALPCPYRNDAVAVCRLR